MSALAILAAGSQALTMSSLEIADLVNSAHADVRRSMERLAERGTITLSPLAEVSNPGPGPRTIKVYNVGKRDSYVIVAQLSPEFTAALVDRWQELEAGAGGLPRTFAEALRLAADQQERIEHQQAALAAAAPKVEFVERYVEATGSKGFRQVCKLLGAGEPAFRAFLSDQQVMYRLGGEWMPHQRHIDAGRFEIKTGASDVSGHAFNTAKFTPKGVEWISRLWREHEAAHA